MLRHVAECYATPLAATSRVHDYRVSDAGYVSGRRRLIIRFHADYYA